MKESYSYNNLYDIGEHYKHAMLEVGEITNGYGLPGVLGLIAKIVEFGYGTNEVIIAVCHMLHCNEDGNHRLEYNASIIEYLIEIFGGADPNRHIWNWDEDGRLFLIQKYIQ